MASLLASPTSLAWSSQLVARASPVAARAPRAVVTRASPRRLTCVAMERSVHREDKEKVLVRVNLGDHRENLEVESHGGEVYWVPLGKPLGIVFKEAPDGAVLVDELVPRGNADKADPPIQPGDRLLATSAWASDPNGQRQQVMFKAVGEPFDIVMAAIGSNSCAQCHVAVVLERQGKATRSE